MEVVHHLQIHHQVKEAASHNHHLLVKEVVPHNQIHLVVTVEGMEVMVAILGQVDQIGIIIIQQLLLQQIGQVTLTFLTDHL